MKNTGELTGKETVQLYVLDVKSTMIRPVKELKGFGKVALAPSETKTVTMTLGKRAFAYYDVDMKDWHVESGEFEIQIGRSSQIIELTETVHVESTVPAPKPVFTRNTTIGDVLVYEDAAAVIRPIVDQLTAQFSQMGGEEEEDTTSDMMEASMKYLPLRNIVMFSGGAFSEENLQDVLAKMNNLNK